MRYKHRWEEIDSIGAGGQGKVIRVLDRPSVKLDLYALTNAISRLDTVGLPREEKQKILKQIREEIVHIIQAENPMNHGALKILHTPTGARNFEDAEERLIREIEAMAQADHPNLLKVLDHDLEEKWFVSKYYPNGTLSRNSELFTGQVEYSLNAVRPLVEGVATLHEKDLVHRDIKPENIFIDERNELILGDFGLVFFKDSGLRRLSQTLENVGSTDWMPQWASRMRLEDVRPTFDVFSLGKTIWSMVSKTSILRLWYHRKEEFDLEKMFPDRPEMALLNDLLDKCIVEEEMDCLENARVLLETIDSLIGALRIGGGPIGDFDRPCRVCGFGNYQIDVDKDQDGMYNLGLRPTSGKSFKILTCNNCGHVQFFFCKNNSDPPGWKKRDQ